LLTKLEDSVGFEIELKNDITIFDKFTMFVRLIDSQDKTNQNIGTNNWTNKLITETQPNILEIPNREYG
jgi:hypothetical protein